VQGETTGQVGRFGAGHPLVWRALVAVLAVGTGLTGAVSFALGTCHDSGGFCADSFSSTHVGAYAVGVVLMSAAVTLLAVTVTLRVVVLAAVALISGLLIAALAVGLEFTR